VGLFAERDTVVGKNELRPLDAERESTMKRRATEGEGANPLWR